MQKIVPWVVTKWVVLALVAVLSITFLSRILNGSPTGVIRQTSRTTGSTSTLIVRDVTATKYNIQAPQATTTNLDYSDVAFAVPWSGITKKRGEGSWNFSNGDFVFVALSTTTTKSVWSKIPGIEKIIPIDSSSDYDLEKMVWESHVQDAALLESGGQRQPTT